MSLTTELSISKNERLMAGTPYCRERKLVTSSSERNPSFTSAEPRRAPDSFWVLSACSSCSGVMTFSLTSRSPRRCDILLFSDRNWIRLRPRMRGALKLTGGKDVRASYVALTQIVNRELLLDW